MLNPRVNYNSGTVKISLEEAKRLLLIGYFSPNDRYNDPRNLDATREVKFPFRCSTNSLPAPLRSFD